MFRFSLFILFVIFLVSPINEDFLKEQKRYKRVRNALELKEHTLRNILLKHSKKLGDIQILFIAFKEEGELELFAKSKGEQAYSKITTYKVCKKSGELGPKRKQGDLQVPEGFYHIDRYNPASSYHLSLGLDYPNSSDKIKSKAANLGGDIFIHGSCVTIGCLPMTDDKIKEIYLLSVYARNNGQKTIPVYIFPFKMNEMNYGFKKLQYGTNKILIDFWDNIKTGYDQFMKNKTELKFKVDANGDYFFL